MLSNKKLLGKTLYTLFYHILLAREVNVCNEGNKRCEERSFCGDRYLTIDTNEPYCQKCEDYSSSCTNNFNPGWVPMNETCNNNWNCLRSSETLECFSNICENNVCTKNADYQRCFKEETLKKSVKNVLKWIGIACGIILSIVFLFCLWLNYTKKKHTGKNIFGCR